jgi:hypothetical protein
MKTIFRTVIAVIMVMVSFSSKGDEKPYLNAFEGDSVVWKSCLELNFEGFENPVSEVVLFGDTLIDGVKWKIFSRFGCKGLIRMEDAKVIFTPYPGYEGSALPFIGVETVIYDFSLEVGDVFIEFGMEQTVTSIDSVELNDGRKHKRITFNDRTRIIEGLGNDFSDPFHMLYGQETMASVATLMCCHVNGELLYLNPDYQDCEGNKVSNEFIGDNPQKSSVTVTDGSLHVTFGGDALFNVTVYNMQGVMMKQQKASRHEATIPVQNLTQGVYVVQITSGGHTGVHRFIR